MQKNKFNLNLNLYIIRLTEWQKLMKKMVDLNCIISREPSSCSSASEETYLAISSLKKQPTGRRSEIAQPPPPAPDFFSSFALFLPLQPLLLLSPASITLIRIRKKKQKRDLQKLTFSRTYVPEALWHRKRKSFRCRKR